MNNNGNNTGQSVTDIDHAIDQQQGQQGPVVLSEPPAIVRQSMKNWLNKRDAPGGRRRRERRSSKRRKSRKSKRKRRRKRKSTKKKRRRRRR